MSNPDTEAAGLVRVTRLYADESGNARFEDVELAMLPDPPPTEGTAMSWRAA